MSVGKTFHKPTLPFRLQSENCDVSPSSPAAPQAIADTQQGHGFGDSRAGPLVSTPGLGESTLTHGVKHQCLLSH